VSFPIFAKIDVNGPDGHPLYWYLKSEKSDIFGTESIKWNFTKFRVDRQGKVVGRYGPATKPRGLASQLKHCWTARLRRLFAFGCPGKLQAERQRRAKELTNQGSSTDE
jgi:hypothetical protein